MASEAGRWLPKPPAAEAAAAAETPVDPVSPALPAEPEAVAELDVADVAPMGTGEVQVTLLWTSGDDLDLHLTEPSGETIYYQMAASASGGALDVADLGGGCTVPANRAENGFWTSGAPHGVYTVVINNYQACSADPALAKVQVRIGGQLVIDQVVTVGVDAPIQFTVGDAAGGLRRAGRPAGSVAGAPVFTQAAAISAEPVLQVLPAKKVECKKEGSAILSTRAGFGPRTASTGRS